jgi:hypothetical protein
MVPTFLDWAKNNKLELGDVNEDRIRTGVKFGYPDAYVRAQYPDAYFPPHFATAPLDLKNQDKTPGKAAPKGTPG